MVHALRKILREVHRRSVWQVVGIYLAGSWGGVEFVDFATRFGGLPGWTPTLAFALLLAGLPIVTATAFVQKGFPALRGEYRDEVDPNELEGLTPGQVHRDPRTHPLYGERIFTWRNAILGGVGGAALLVGSVIAYLGMWAAGVGPMGNLVAQGVLVEGDPVIVADFDDATGEGLGEIATQALRVDLSQGDVLRPLEAGELRDVMARMQLARGTRLSADLAREAAAREGVQVVLDGEVASAGAGYLITAALGKAGSERPLASFHSAAESPEDVLPAIGRLSRDIREKSGESLRHIRADASLEAVTTASLEAFHLYVESGHALERDDRPDAIDLLHAALALDPEFALAWRRLTAVHGDSGLDPAGLVEAATRAYEYRARLTERERSLAEAFYHEHVAPEGGRASNREG